MRRVDAKSRQRRTGVVDENVDAAKGLVGVLDHRDDLLLRLEIGLDEDRLDSVLLLDALSRRLDLRRVSESVEHDVAAARRQSLRRPLALYCVPSVRDTRIALACATAKPMPDVEPVTSAVLPKRTFIMFVLFFLFRLNLCLLVPSFTTADSSSAALSDVYARAFGTKRHEATRL